MSSSYSLKTRALPVIVFTAIMLGAAFALPATAWAAGSPTTSEKGTPAASQPSDASATPAADATDRDASAEPAPSTTAAVAGETTSVEPEALAEAPAPAVAPDTEATSEGTDASDAAGTGPAADTSQGAPSPSGPDAAGKAGGGAAKQSQPAATAQAQAKPAAPATARAESPATSKEKAAAASTAKAAAATATAKAASAAPSAAKAAGAAAAPAKQKAATTTASTAKGTASAGKGVTTQAAKTAAPAAKAPAKAPAAPAKASAKKTVAAQAAPAEGNLAGTYYIESKRNLAMVLDMSGASKKAGGNAIVWAYNAGKNQQWRLVYDKASKGYFIQNVNSGKVLDISGARGKSGANVIQWGKKASGNRNQLWAVSGSASAGYTFASLLNRKLLLDVEGGRARQGDNVEIWTSNGGANQLWYLLPIANSKETSDGTVSSGIYTIAKANGNGKNSNQLLDVEGASQASGANVDVWQANRGQNQKWALTYDKATKLYSIVSVGSGKALAVQNSNRTATANVQQASRNGKANQQWAVKKNADGTFSIISKLSGMALATPSNAAANGTNAMVSFNRKGSKAQEWVIAPTRILEDEFYTIAARSNTREMVDVPNQSNKNVQLALWETNGGMNQKYQVAYDKDLDAYTVQSAASGKYLTDSNGKAMQTYKSSSKAQRWFAKWQGDGIKLVNVATGKAIDISGSAKNGAKAITAKDAVKASQRFAFTKVNVIDDGMYTVKTATANRLLDVKGASNANNAALDIWTANNGKNQKFSIKKVGSYYKIIGAASGKAVSASGTNVSQKTYTGSAEQLWKVQISPNGGLIFVNRANGRALNVAGSISTGSKVNASAVNETAAAQRWTVAPTVMYSGYQEKAYNKVLSRGSSTNWYVVANIGVQRIMIFHRDTRDSFWYLYNEWKISSGIIDNGVSRTPIKDGRVGGKQYQLNDPAGTWTAYWATYWGGTWYHSIIYRYKSRTVSDPRLGRAVSNGCIRMTDDQAKWIYDNIPRGTSTTTTK